MAASPDVIVIGGGIVGTACARSLALRGASVTILQGPERPGEGWRASAGMLAAQIESRPDDPMLALSIAGRAFYRRNAPLLLESTGIDIGLVECGILQVSQTEADVLAAKAKVARQRQQGHRADWLSRDEVAEGWPWLESGMGGFWSPEDGAIDPVRTVAAFNADAVRLGVRVIPDLATSVTSAQGRVTGVRGDAGTYNGAAVVIAAGAWSGRIDGLPRPLSVEPVKGQLLAYQWPHGAPATVVYGPDCYLLRRGDEMIVGATMEHSGFDAGVTPDATEALAGRAAALYPALRAATPIRSWSGLRPGTPDGVPIIGAEPRLAGLWYATGHGRNGVLLAGITGDVIAQRLGGSDETADIAAARPERFWSF